MFNDLKQLLENAGVSLSNENSLGEKIIPDDDPVKLQNFWNWFGNSKVVDEQGRPLVVYHMSDYKFNTFDISKQQGRTWGKGFYFSSDKLGNHLYGENEYVCYLKAKNPYITNFPKTYNEFVKLCNEILNYNNKEELENCFDYFSGFFNQRAVYAFSKIYLELYGADRPNTPYTEKGYDSIIINDSLIGSQGEASINKEIVVFKPNQIKVVNNAGTFSSESNNIYETVAYHGTPQKFDEFSLKYIGNGEGVQAHGWGIYFALNKNVAQAYKDTLSNDWDKKYKSFNEEQREWLKKINRIGYEKTLQKAEDELAELEKEYEIVDDYWYSSSDDDFFNSPSKTKRDVLVAINYTERMINFIKSLNNGIVPFRRLGN